MAATTYAGSREVDLGGYAASMASYAALVAAASAAGRRRGLSLTDRTSLRDLLVGGVATHKLSRLLAKGSVTSPLRAPFTEMEGAAGMAEHLERARDGSHLRHTVGELLTCPFCLGVWLATAYVGALAVAPRQARAVAAVFGVVAISDWLQVGYEIARSKALED